MSSATNARNKALVPHSTGDTQFNVRDAALHGASLAFSKPPPQPQPLTNTYTGGTNGALLAATKVGTGSPRNVTPHSSPLRRDWTGGSLTGRPSPSPMQLSHKSSNSSTLAVPDDYFSDRTSSPSNIAAKLAAARHSPLKPIPQPAVMAIPNERDGNERDVLPPAGSVRNVLARLDSGMPSSQPRNRNASIGSQSIASTIRDSTDDHRATDDTPIPPTTSLVKMFEQTRPTGPTGSSYQPTEPLQVSQKAPPPVRSPKPQRTFNLPPEPQDLRPVEQNEAPILPTSKPTPKPKFQRELTLPVDGSQEHQSFSNLRRDTLGTPPVKQKPPQLTTVSTSTSRPRPPSALSSSQSQRRSEDLPRSTSIQRRLSSSLSMESNSSFVSAPEEQEEEKFKPTLPPPRRSATGRSKSVQPETRPKSSPAPQPPKPRSASKMASPMKIPERIPPPRGPISPTGSPHADSLFHSNYQRESAKQITKHMTGESLSNAIVGAALASSRNASPAPKSIPAPPPPTRRHHHHLPLHLDRSPSPQKPTGKLRTTLRREPSSSSDEDEGEKYKKKGSRIMGMGRKHPNKHHEGTRKRWRDAITERERKRYDGVWAANKGLCIPPQATGGSDSSLDVCNLVVKEIWSRSRLPVHELEEVWDLVDGRGFGRLCKEEFVVGMWLIDQRLKGRKLPLKVSESVWGSVRGVGVKVKVGPRK